MITVSPEKCDWEETSVLTLGFRSTMDGVVKFMMARMWHGGHPIHSGGEEAGSRIKIENRGRFRVLPPSDPLLPARPHLLKTSQLSK